MVLLTGDFQQLVVAPGWIQSKHGTAMKRCRLLLHHDSCVIIRPESIAEFVNLPFDVFLVANQNFFYRRKKTKQLVSVLRCHFTRITAIFFRFSLALFLQKSVLELQLVTPHAKSS